MKYILVLGDGMGDYPIDKLGKKTPLQAARKFHIDYLAERGIIGTACTIPEGMPPGSDTANLSVLGYNPAEYYSGRSPFEAAGMGVLMEDDDISFRCNLVTLSGDEQYGAKTLVDYSAGEVSTDEAEELIGEIKKHFSSEAIDFYRGISYRHLMVWKNGPYKLKLTPPHDIIGKKIAGFLPEGDSCDIIKNMMTESYRVLNNHIINRKRMEKGLSPANSIWIWGEGKKPSLPLFRNKYGLEGSVITAVDLVKGIGAYAGMEFVEVPGATGNIDTNYSGKAQAALKALKQGKDFVFIHIEAPDECGHRNETDNKVKAIEMIDKMIVKSIREEMEKFGTDYRMMILPDHFTPLSLRTHTTDAVPFLIYQNNDEKNNTGKTYDEYSAGKSGLHLKHGYKLMDLFLQKDFLPGADKLPD